MSSAYFIPILLWWACLVYDERVARKSTGSRRARQARQECERAVLVEHVVQVAALRALDARRAAVRARAAPQERRGVCSPPFELLEAALGDPDPARVTVVDEDSGPARLGMHVRREAADVPAVAHRPERQQRDQRMLRGVEGAEELR